MDDKLSPILREIDTRAETIRQTELAIDAAADASDLELVKTLQAELAASQTLLASARRRLERAKRVVTEDERLAQQKANAAAAELVVAQLAEDAKRADAIERTLQKLAEQISELVAGSRPAEVALASILKSFDPYKRTGYLALTDVLGAHSGRISARIHSVLGETDHLREFNFRKLPPLGETYRDRADKLAPRVRAVLAEANGGAK